MNAGIEYSFNDLLFLRTGQSHLFMDSTSDGLKAEQGLSFGFGVNYQIPRGLKIRVDYVRTDFGVFNNIEGLSLNFNF